MTERHHNISRKKPQAPHKPRPAAVERIDLADVKVYNLPATSLAYQLSMAAHVVTAVRQGYSMQHALAAIEMEDAARANVQRLSFETMRHWGCTHFWLTHFIPNAPTIWVQALLSVALTQLRQQSASEFVLVEDCEIVTRQLQYVLEVEGVDYARLEVSSPGLDRPLRKPADWARFVGEDIEVTLREAFQGRKKWRGVLAASEDAAADGQAWRLVLPAAKPLSRTAAKKLAKAAASGQAAPADAAQQALDFNLDEVREARLVPVVDFKGRRGPDGDGGEAARMAAEAEEMDGGQD